MPDKQNRAITMLLFSSALLWYSWFLTPSRGADMSGGAALASSVVLDHTVHINRYFRNADERMERGGDYYSAQAPGAAWLAMPALTVWSFKRIVDPGDPWQIWVMSVTTTALPSALAAVLVFLFVNQIAGGSRGAGLAAAAAYAFATPAFPAATTFNAAQPAAAMLFCVFLMGSGTRRAGGAALMPFGDAAAGFIAGAACTTLGPCAPVAGILTAWYIAARALSSRGRVAAAGVLSGAAIPLACLAAYHFAAFGRWTLFAPGAVWPGTSFSLRAAGLPLVTLLAASPFLALAAPGVSRLHRNPDTRTDAAIMILAIAAAVACAVAAAGVRAVPSGGNALLPALPFCCAGFGVFAAGLPRGWRAACMAAVTLSAAAMLAAAATDPAAPLHQAMSMLLHGRLRPTILDALTAHPAARLGIPVALTLMAALFCRAIRLFKDLSVQ